MDRQSINCASVALFTLSLAACVMQQPAASEPPTGPASNPTPAPAAPEQEAATPDPTETASDTPAADTGGYVPEGKVWKDAPLDQCLPAYRKCVESIPPDARGNLGLSYEHHLAGIGMMEQGKVDAAVAVKQCNAMMFMLQQGGKC